MRAVGRILTPCSPRRGVIVAGVSGVLALGGVLLSAQQAPPAVSTPAADAPSRSFEVASVKPNTANDNRTMIGFQPGGRYSAVGAPLRFIIRNAFRVQESQLLGLPEWTRTERFDITAKADVPNPTPEMMSEMLRSLLIERFKLVTHRETREMPVYDLVLARADGKLGPELKPSTLDCEAMRAARRGGPPEAGRMTMPLGRGGPAPDARGVAPGAVPSCAMRMMPGNFTASGGSLNQLAETLEMQAGRIVRNKTGLTGGYDFSLTFTPEQMTGGRAPDAPAADSGSAPSIFTALQEQLGLKLDSVRAPVEVVVVDRVERPTPD